MTGIRRTNKGEWAAVRNGILLDTFPGTIDGRRCAARLAGTSQELS